VSVAENKAVIRHMIKELNNQNLAVLDEAMADNCILRFPTGQEMNREGYKQLLTELINAFPDIKATIDSIIAEGDEVAVRFILEGTHKGSFMGMPPTGKTIRVTEDYFGRFEGGKLIELRYLEDTLAFQQQLGISPPPVQS
jgi:steroid delta-isomerase-like uncharacterized protein